MAVAPFGPAGLVVAGDDERETGVRVAAGAVGAEACDDEAGLGVGVVAGGGVGAAPLQTTLLAFPALLQS